jgi:hypothetical protein
VSTDHRGAGMDNGAALRPLNADGIVAAAGTARDCGLSPTGPVGTEVAGWAVHWRRMDLRYTFHDMLFRKPPI